MNAERFMETLNELGASYSEYADHLTKASGRPVSRTTMYRYATGRSKIPAGVAAHLELLLRVQSDAAIELPLIGKPSAAVDPLDELLTAAKALTRSLNAIT